MWVLAQLFSSSSDRHHAAQTGIWGGWARLSLCVVTRADGERHSEPSVHRGGPVQQPPVRHQRPECPRSGRAGASHRITNSAFCNPLHWFLLLGFSLFLLQECAYFLFFKEKNKLEPQRIVIKHFILIREKFSRFKRPTQVLSILVPISEGGSFNSFSPHQPFLLCAHAAGETLHSRRVGQRCAKTTSGSASSHRHICAAQVTGERPVSSAAGHAETRGHTGKSSDLIKIWCLTGRSTHVWLRSRPGKEWTEPLN